MYHNNDIKQTTYYPNTIQSPTNQKSFYTNSLQEQLSLLEDMNNLLNERLDKRFTNLHRKTMNLSSRYWNLEDLQQKMLDELTQHKNKQDNQKKRIINKLYRLESVIQEELQPVVSEQENLKNQLLQWLGQHEKLVNDQQERANKQIQEQVDENGVVITQELHAFIDQQTSMNKKVQEQLNEHEFLIHEELSPYIKNMRNILANPVANLLKNLYPGILLEQITVQGTVIEVKSFINYDLYTNTSLFLLENNNLLTVDINRIDSLTFG